MCRAHTSWQTARTCYSHTSWREFLCCQAVSAGHHRIHPHQYEHQHVMYAAAQLKCSHLSGGLNPPPPAHAQPILRNHHEFSVAIYLVPVDASMSSARGTCRLMGYSDYCDTVSDKDEPTAISWSGTDSTLTEAEYEQCRDLQMYPAAAGAMAVVFNLPGWRSQTERLILTPQIVARIFRANITSWAHPHIVQLNAKLYEAGILTNASIKVVVREEASGNTDIFKSSLAKYDPDFLEQIGTSNQPVWPGVNVERQSNGRLAQALVSFQRS
eukprot:6213062-Pleurochrysis_carterae.AAC.1